MNICKIPVVILALLTILSCTAYKQTTEKAGSTLEDHLFFLASDELGGRFPGSEGDIMAARYIEKYFGILGLEAGKQDFSFMKSLKKGPLNSFSFNGIPASSMDYTPFGFSADTATAGLLVFAGYGITVKADSFEWDDYKEIDVKGKWVMALRGTPDIEGSQNYLDLASDDRDKAMLAADNGAAGIILISGFRFGQDDKLSELGKIEAPVMIPAIHITRSLADTILGRADKNIREIESVFLSGRMNSFATGVYVEAESDIDQVKGVTSNVFGILNGSGPLSGEYILVGAHYDHLGYGGKGSSSRHQDTSAVHNGADDNASGISVMLELAARICERRDEFDRSFIFVAFGAEEMGLLGSKHFVNNMPVDLFKVTAMVNLDMVGRLDTAKGVQIGGTGTSLEADSLISVSNKHNLKLRLTKDGSGPSDHSSFYGKNIPVFFITTGAHTDYHTPEDDAGKINFEGMHVITDFTECLVSSIATHQQKLTFAEAGPKETATPGYRFKVTLGFMPDFTSSDIQGVRVDFVSKGKAAERGGIKNGDIITAIDGMPVKNIYDYMYRLGKLSKNQIISVEILRNGSKEVLLIQL